MTTVSETVPAETVTVVSIMALAMTSADMAAALVVVAMMEAKAAVTVMIMTTKVEFIAKAEMSVSCINNSGVDDTCNCSSNINHGTFVLMVAMMVLLWQQQ